MLSLYIVVLALGTWIYGCQKQQQIMRLMSLACHMIQLLCNCFMTGPAIPNISLGSTIPMTLHWTSSLDNGWMGKCWITANSRSIYCCHNKKKTHFQHFHYWTPAMTTPSNESLSRRIIQAFPNNRPVTVFTQRECTRTAYPTIQLLIQALENTTENHRSNGNT